MFVTWLRCCKLWECSICCCSACAHGSRGEAAKPGPELISDQHPISVEGRAGVEGREVFCKSRFPKGATGAEQRKREANRWREYERPIETWSARCGRG